MIFSANTKSSALLGCVFLTASIVASGANAAITLPPVASAPVGAAVQSAGGAVSAVGQGHAGVAPVVTSTAPALEPFADGVTQGLTTVGSLTSLSGQRIQQGGLSVAPVAGARTAVQTVRNGSIAQVRVGSTQIGRGSPTTIVGVGAATSAPPHGTLATAGVLNANALLNGNLAPQ